MLPSVSGTSRRIGWRQQVRESGIQSPSVLHTKPNRDDVVPHDLRLSVLCVSETSKKRQRGMQMPAGNVDFLRMYPDDT